MAQLVAGAAESSPKVPVLETDTTSAQQVVRAAAPGNKLRTLVGTKILKVLASLRILGYGIDDQADPAIHPFFDSEGSLKTRFGGRSYKRDKKYTAGAGAPDPGTVSFDPKAGSPIELESLFLIIGGTKATAATAYIGKENSGGKDLGMYSRDGAIAASEILALPALGRRQNGVAAATETVDSSTKTIIHNPDVLIVSVKTMANAELFIVRARLLVHGPDDPDVTVQADLTEADE